MSIKISYYQIAGYTIQIEGDTLVSTVRRIPGFPLFKKSSVDQVDVAVISEENMPDLSFPSMYEVEFEDILFQFGKIGEEYGIKMSDYRSGEIFRMCTRSDSSRIYATPTSNPIIFRFALWMAYNMAVLPFKSAAIHASTICYDGQAVLFLGESGTGKSTHTRLWREHIHGSDLLNDDSPIVRVEADGRIMAYGSPWSGKTPCYRDDCFPLKAMVRLSQAPYNRIRKLSILESIAALLPSCPPALAKDRDKSVQLYEYMSSVLSSVPVYALECLPDAEAAELAFSTIFQKESKD